MSDDAQEKRDALKQILGQRDKMLIVICRNCGEHTAYSLFDLLIAPEKEIWAPNLCPECGNYPPEKSWYWLTTVAAEKFSAKRGGFHLRPHRYRQACTVLWVKTLAQVEARRREFMDRKNLARRLARQKTSSA